MTTDWTFGGLWPYQPRWFDTRDGRLHYIDEGPRDGKPVVFVHGNPTWGFLYRNFVPPLVGAGYRVIVPDLLGFGRSEKPPNPELYRISQHVRRFEELLESLDLHDATVVPQDWGGPIAMPWAVTHPERVARLFLLNTAVHAPRRAVTIPLPLKLFRMRGVGEVMVKGLAMFHHAFLFKVGLVHRERMTKQLKQAYLAPHPTWSSRTGVLVFPREIPAGPDEPWSRWAAEIEVGMEKHFRDKPVKIVWAMDDPGFVPEYLDDFWLRTFPDAEIVRLHRAGHYLQEDAHERIVPELLGFLAATD